MAVMRLPGPSLRILYAYSGVARPLSTGAGRGWRGRAGPAREARDEEVGMSGRDDTAAALAAAGAYRRLAEQALLDRPLARRGARAARQPGRRPPRRPVGRLRGAQPAFRT